MCYTFPFTSTLLNHITSIHLKTYVVLYKNMSSKSSKIIMSALLNTSVTRIILKNIMNFNGHQKTNWSTHNFGFGEASGYGLQKR